MFKINGIKPKFFTMIEILAVCAIAGILLAMAMPAFEKLAKGSGVSAGARQICSRLKLARAKAITNNKCVALVMPMYADSAGNIPSGYNNVCTRLAFVTDPDNGNDADFVRWAPEDKWEFLPTGTIILEVDNSNSDDPTQVGAQDSPSHTVGGTTTRITDKFGTDSDITANGAVAAVIFKPSGRTIGSAVYVEIGEGSADGGSLTVTNKGANSFLRISVDEYTGRVTMGED